MQLVKIETLKPHEKNTEFFDDMTGDKWQEFLRSIETSGVIEPIVITQDKVIVSGHQRVRACKELGITEILAEVRVYESNDMIIKDLLETNIRQRGNIGGSTVKLGRRIRELERIYGIRQGNNQYSEDSANGTKLTETELASQLDIDLTTLKRAKSLTDLPPEIQDLIEQGSISPSTASRLIAKLSPEDQEQLVKSLPMTQKLTQNQVQSYIDKLKETQRQMNEYKEKADKADELEEQISKYEEQMSGYREKIVALVKERDKVKRAKTEIVKETVEVDNSETPAEIERLRSELAESEEHRHSLYKDLMEQTRLLNKAIGSNTNYQLVSHCSEVTLKMLNFIKEMALYDYMAESFNEIPEAAKREYVRCITSVKKWADNILDVIDNQNSTIVIDIE